MPVTPRPARRRRHRRRPVYIAHGRADRTHRPIPRSTAPRSLRTPEPVEDWSHGWRAVLVCVALFGTMAALCLVLWAVDVYTHPEQTPRPTVVYR